MAATIEIAVDTVGDAVAAQRAGADRLELCTSLDAQGLSADPRVLADFRRESGLPVAAMVRPREGHFVPTPSDQFLAPRHAEALLAAGADAIVFGYLFPDASVHEDLTDRLVRVCGAADAVFHRAFDLAPDPLAAIDRLVDLGVRRILTAGMSPLATAWSMGLAPAHGPAAPPAPAPEPIEVRLARLRTYVEHARGRIEILPCGGIRAANAREFLTLTGAGQIHSACRRPGGASLDVGQVDLLVAAVRGGPGAA
jgi:copper homeostasis protein